MTDVNIKVNAVDGASGVFQTVAKNLRAMRKESAAAGENVFESTFSSAENMTKALLDRLGVGLAGAAIQIAGDQLAKVTEKLVDIRNRMNEGKTSAAELALEFGKSLPILGGIVAAGANIREGITGERAEVERLNAEAEATNRYFDARRKMAEELGKQQKDYLETTKKLQDEIRLLALAESERPAAVIQIKARDERKKIEEKIAELERASKVYNAARPDAAKQVAANDAEIERLDSKWKNRPVHAGEGGIKDREMKRLADLRSDRAKWEKQLEEMDQAEAARKAQALQYQTTLADQEKKKGMELLDAQKNLANKRADLAFETERRLAEIRSGTARARFVAAGRPDVAELQDISDRYQREKAEADHRREVAMRTASNAEVTTINRNHGEELFALRQRYDADTAAAVKRQSQERVEAEKRLAEDRLKLTRELNRQAIDAETERHAMILELQGKSADAARVRLKADGDKRVAMLKQQALDEQKAHPALAQQIQAVMLKELVNVGLDLASRAKENARNNYWLADASSFAGPPELNVSSRGSGAAFREREQAKIDSRLAEVQKELGAIRAAAEALAAFARNNPEITKVLAGFNN